MPGPDRGVVLACTNRGMRRSSDARNGNGVTVRFGLIDVHSHHYPDSYLDACRRPDSGLEHYIRDDGRLVVLQDGAVAAAVPQPLPGMDHRLAMMDEADVSHQVLSVSAPNVFRLPPALRIPLTRDLNDEFGDVVGSSAGRLRYFASLPLPDVDAALAELDRVGDRPGVAGVMLCTTVDRRTLDDPHLAPLWEELSRRSTVVFVHPTTACCTEGLRDSPCRWRWTSWPRPTNAMGRLIYSGTPRAVPGDPLDLPATSAGPCRSSTTASTTTRSSSPRSVATHPQAVGAVAGAVLRHRQHPRRRHALRLRHVSCIAVHVRHRLPARSRWHACVRGHPASGGTVSGRLRQGQVAERRRLVAGLRLHGPPESVDPRTARSTTMTNDGTAPALAMPGVGRTVGGCDDRVRAGRGIFLRGANRHVAG